MTTIFCITEWDSDMKQTNSELFMSMEGVANWLTKQHPINNQFNVTDSGIEGDYDITAENLANVLKENEKNGVAASFTIKQSFIVQVFKTRFTLSTIKAND